MYDSIRPGQVWLDTEGKRIQAHGGSIIYMSSVVGIGGNAGQANYAASKAGMIALAKSIAQEVGSRGIRANAIAPGFFVSNQNRALLFNEDGTPTPRTDKILRSTPMGRFGGGNRTEKKQGVINKLIKFHSK